MNYEEYFLSFVNKTILFFNGKYFIIKRNNEITVAYLIINFILSMK